MPTGSLICTQDIYLTVTLDEIGHPSASFSALNGYLNIYNDSDPFCQDIYCQNFFCNCGHIYAENCLSYSITNTGESDSIGVFCRAARSDGTGYFFWSKIYCSGVILTILTGFTGIVDQPNSNPPFATTGYYCCRFISDGIGGDYSELIPYYGTIFEQNPLYINICGTSYQNGYCNLISDGGSTDCCFYVNNYCEVGVSYFCSGLFNFISDGCGGFDISELSIRNTYNVCISSDFSKRTKTVYNFLQKETCGETVFLSLQNCSNLFYEINAISDSSVCIFEANACKSLFIDNSLVPFFYIKNVGTARLNIDLSNSTLNRDFFKNCKIFTKNSYSNSSILLCKNESIFLTFNVSSDGTEYYSKVIYPFGFFYEFKNIENVNPLGLSPVCCAFDEVNSCFFPIFTYVDVLNLPIENNSVITTGYGYNYRKLPSSNEDLNVDCSDLEISFFKRTGSASGDIFQISTGFDICSNYGINLHKAKIKTNSIAIFDNQSCCGISSIDDVFNARIESDNSIKIVYDVDFDFSKNYKLIYLDSLCSGSNYDFMLTIDSSSGLKKYTRQCVNSLNNIIDINNNDFAYIDLFLDNTTAIKDLNNSNIQRNNLYLPVKNNFNYCYCFCLRNSNFIEDRKATGFWGSSSQISNNASGFCNYTTLIHCNDPEYQQYKSCVYSLNLCSTSNKCSTNSIKNTNSLDVSDLFLLTYCSIECSYCYCDLEFKYTPVDYVFYKNTFHKVPDECININFCAPQISEIICFPINAINPNKLKIKTISDVFDKMSNSELDVNFLDFSLKLKCANVGNIDYKFPIVQCVNLSGYEHPNIFITNEINRSTQSNIIFSVNPSKCFISDSNYGLNNFLLFLNSKFNCGLALDFINCQDKVISDYFYNSSDYSFLMMDIQREHETNTGYSIVCNDWINIFQKTSFEDNFEIMPYKNTVGNGYNYIFPIVKEICYSDHYTGNNEVVCIDIVKSGILNYFNTGFNYDGLSTTQVPLTGQTGNITGTGYLINSGASFLNSNNLNFISLNGNDLTGTVPCRNITISKSYVFTGVQPIYIASNYQLADISSPMVNSNFQKYSYSANQDSTSGLFYYLYSINEPKNVPIKIVAPDLTLISNINWRCESVSSQDNTSRTIQIINSAAKIDLQINDFISDNCYFLNTDTIKSLCVNIIGGL